MKLDELVQDLNITVEDYFYNFYDIPENTLFVNPIWAIQNAKKTKKLFILESNTFNDFEDVKIALSFSEKNINLFQELKEKSFYFIVKIKEELKDKYIVPNEIFTSLDEAKNFAKEFFKG